MSMVSVIISLQAGAKEHRGIGSSKLSNSNFIYYLCVCALSACPDTLHSCLCIETCLFVLVTHDKEIVVM